MSPTGLRQRIGKWGEQVAGRFLEGHGYAILSHNWRTPYGEIDLIAEKTERTVFVEVKTRTALGYGLPEDSVTTAKRAHLLAAIAHYWQERGEEEKDWQVDVIAVIGRPGGGEIQVEHFENVFN